MHMHMLIAGVSGAFSWRSWSSIGSLRNCLLEYRGVEASVPMYVHGHPFGEYIGIN